MEIPEEKLIELYTNSAVTREKVENIEIKLDNEIKNRNENCKECFSRVRKVENNELKRLGFNAGVSVTIVVAYHFIRDWFKK